MSDPKHKPSDIQGSVPLPAALVGVVARVEEGQIFVTFEGAPTDVAVPARTTVAISSADIGREVALVFVHGAPEEPVITGLFRTGDDKLSDDLVVKVDGEVVKIRGDKRIVLECGKASITLTDDGKVLVRGTYFLAQSSGITQLQGRILRLN